MTSIDTLLVSFCSYPLDGNTLGDLEHFTDMVDEFNFHLGLFASSELNWLFTQRFTFVSQPSPVVSLESIEHLLGQMCRRYSDPHPNGYLFVILHNREEMNGLFDFLKQHMSDSENYPVIDRFLAPDDNFNNLTQCRLGRIIECEYSSQPIPEYFTLFPRNGDDLSTNLSILFGLFDEVESYDGLDYYLVIIAQYYWNQDRVDILDKIFSQLFYSLKEETHESHHDLLVQQVIEVFAQRFSRDEKFRLAVREIGERIASNLSFYSSWFIDEESPSPLENMIHFTGQELRLVTDRVITAGTANLNLLLEKYEPLFYPCFGNSLVEISS